MRTDYIRLVQHCDDKAFGSLVIDWIYTPLIRVTTNRIGRQQWEYVGQQGCVLDADHVQKIRYGYPLVMFAHEVAR